MKQIPILNGKAMVVEVPEESYAFDIVGSTWLECHRHTDDLGFTTDMIDLPPGNWRIIGMLSEVRESEASKLVKYTGLGGYVDSYENHQNEGYLFLPTAIESLDSAILAEGYYLDDNPHGDEPKPENTPNYAYSVDVRIWEAAQSRVLDRSRCLLLGREI